MKFFLKFMLILFLFSSVQVGLSQEIASYYSRNIFLRGAPGSYDDGLLGFANPANLVMLNQFNARYYWSTEGTDNGKLRDWGVFTASPGFGFSVFRQEMGDFSVTDYNIALAGGNLQSGFGFAYRWSTGDEEAFSHEKLFTLGWLMRPSRYLSLGLIGSLSTETSAKEGVFEMGIRPLGSPRLTLFGDYALQKDQKLEDAPWSAGGALQLVQGINLVGRYFESEAFTLGINFSFGSSHASGQLHFDDRQEHRFNSYSVGFGDFQPNIFDTYLLGQNKYVEMKLKGRVDYKKYKWFDDETNRLMEILQNIRNAVDDPRVQVITVNLSAMRVLPEHAWEIRQELKEAQDAGKKVIIFIDNAQMTDYHLASVADKIMLDPQGSIMLPGYILGRTYFKGTLDKLGLGFNEWRYFKYKSAAEALSRKDMSEADSLQNQMFVNDMYSLVRNDVCQSRNLVAEKFDQLINENVYFMPNDALEEGLVDTLCRWKDLNGVIKSVSGKGRSKLPLELLSERTNIYQNWGHPPYIAVVYALGVCAMDQGIKARQLEKTLLNLAEDNTVKAIVFRVDSPGGDGMASDVVAEALKKCAEKKPVVVSQGQVAASGGYWISMYGDKIVAAPNTITGSIGVIGGWIYDRGFSDKLGMTSDYTKSGKHAELGFGVRFPLLGIQLPARNLTEEEQQKVESLIKRMYDQFVQKVAAGRDLPEDSVRQVAQGRIYSGVDGKENKLVDEIGGLFTAVEIARTLAGIDDDAKYQIKEISKYKGFFDTDFLSPVSVRQTLEDDPTIQFLRMMAERPGYPFPILRPGTYPTLD